MLMGAKLIKGYHAELKEASDLRRELQDRIADALLKVDGKVEKSVFRVELNIPHINPLEWLRASKSTLKTYWKSRDSHLVVAGLGSAMLLKGSPEDPFFPVKELEEEILPASSSGVRAFGGIRFAPRVPVSGEWQSFGASSFLIPRFQVEQERGRSRLICNIVRGQDASLNEEIIRQVSQLVLPRRTHWSLLRPPFARENSPGEIEWHDAIRRILNAIESGVVEKIVLARKAVFSFLDQLDPIRMLAGLEQVAHNSFRFLFQLNDQAAFVGASPEKLFSRSGHRLVSEAVAGTGQRGRTEIADRRSADELLASEKDQREHAFVRETIRNVLEPMSKRIRFEKKPSLLDLNAGRHLRTRFEASLKDGVQTGELLKQLHPTPAVAGAPLEVAMEFIEKLEQFDRGWYAGPVGWVSKEDAEFAVAIRSGVLAGKELFLYSGAGIVEGSQPNLEWEEIEQKLDNFMRILQLDNSYANYQSRMG